MREAAPAIFPAEFKRERLATEEKQPQGAVHRRTPTLNVLQQVHESVRQPRIRP